MVNEVAIGQSLESALWKLYERVGLPEYAFFAVTIGLQAQTGGSLVETLQNLQDLVRKRVCAFQARQGAGSGGPRVCDDPGRAAVRHVRPSLIHADWLSRLLLQHPQR